MIDLNAKLVGVIRTVKQSLRPDKETDKSEAVEVYLDIDFSNCSVNDVLAYAAADRKIAWASSNRKKFDSLVPGSHVKVVASTPGRTAIDPMDAIVAAAKAAGMSVQDYMTQEMKRRGL